jgi:threonine/homoserine/homoserine lactone efflux protein
MLASIVWWITMMLFFSAPPVRRAYEWVRRGIDAVLGTLLIGVGVRIVVGGR